MPDDSSPSGARPALGLPDGYSRELCDRIAGWQYDRLPAAVVDTSKALILDTLGAIAGASQAPGIPGLLARLSRWEQAGSATGLLGMRRFSPPTAALANGAAAHALDFDDQHDPARVHTSCVVLPTLLATAEDAGPVSGRDFILAFAIGAELHARLGLACHNSLGRGWHPTMVSGTVAASIAAGRLLGLDGEGIANGLGFAYHQASGSAQSMRDGVLSKRIGAGFAARAAVLGAFLGADGLTGTRRTLEGNAGLFALYEGDDVHPGLLTDGLGERWRVPEYSFKPYPCCRCNHTAIGLGIGLHARGIRPSDVHSIEIRIGHVNWLTVGTPYDPARNDVVHAQFNIAYGFARALLDGRVDLESYLKSMISAPEVGMLTARTTIVDDPSIDPTAIEPARVKVVLADGGVIEVGSDTIKGSPQEPMTREEQRAKLRGCLRFGLGAGDAAADRLADAVDTLDQAPDAARALIDAFPR
ncbi:MAG: MmgE/PrpD family protein [bacterium]|jgi:2-methylcitrate dehydratase PrpD|nr:MmgE/PrpD family protein [Betaproteobacteria bacterium]